MQPLTERELQYISDCISNEERLIQQCITAAGQSRSSQMRQTCLQVAERHQVHAQYLMQCLQQHVNWAPQTDSLQMQQR